MQYIVEIPEERLTQLAHAVRAINPQAPRPIPVSCNRDGLTSNMEDVEDYYQDELLEQLPGTPPWNQLSEQTRMDIGTSSASRPGWTSAPSSPDTPHGSPQPMTRWTPARLPWISEPGFPGSRHSPETQEDDPNTGGPHWENPERK